MREALATLKISPALISASGRVREMERKSRHQSGEKPCIWRLRSGELRRSPLANP
jgi:hypothetical protein